MLVLTVLTEVIGSRPGFGCIGTVYVITEESFLWILIVTFPSPVSLEIMECTESFMVVTKIANVRFLMSGDLMFARVN
jgi:hypothetical protein